MKPRPILLLLPLLFFVLFCDGHSPTDPSFGQATLSGLVKDAYGSVWGGVTVSVVRPEGNVVASSLTDSHGRYSLRVLQPGQYRVWLQLGRTGGGYFVADLDLHAGQNTFDIVTR